MLVLLILILWVSVAERYNEALTALARAALPSALSVTALGSQIVIEQSGTAPFSIDGFMLHYGLILLAILVLAAVGIGFVARVGWLLGMDAGAFVLHVIGVTLLARGVAWAYGDTPSEALDTLVFSTVAVF